MRQEHTHDMAQRCRALWMSMVATIGITAVSTAQSLNWLGVLPNSYQSEAYDVSADGSVVVGYAILNDYNYRAFRWTTQAGMQSLGTLTFDRSSFAYAVSADGNVVVGYSFNSELGERAFRWTPQTQLQPLGLNTYRAVSVSPNGEFIVGWYRATTGARAYRWQNGTLLDLGHLGGGDSIAFDVAADGTAIVGEATNSEFQPRAFRWRNGTMEELPIPPGVEAAAASARAVSTDGSVVVGEITTVEEGTIAFRWTESTGSQAILNTLGGVTCSALSVSGDGSIVVGVADTGGMSVGFRWTAQSGMQNLNQVYADLLQGDSYIEAAFGISADGRYIVGKGYNAATERVEAFLLDTEPRCTEHGGDVDQNGCVDDADLLAILFAFGETGSTLGRVDANCDGTVDDSDLLTVLFAFGTGCS